LTLPLAGGLKLILHRAQQRNQKDSTGVSPPWAFPNLFEMSFLYSLGDSGSGDRLVDTGAMHP